MLFQADLVEGFAAATRYGGLSVDSAIGQEANKGPLVACKDVKTCDSGGMYGRAFKR